VFDRKPERKRRRGKSWPAARLGYGGGGDAFTWRVSTSARRPVQSSMVNMGAAITGTKSTGTPGTDAVAAWPTKSCARQAKRYGSDTR
jgi:hypothetical protein